MNKKLMMAMLAAGSVLTMTNAFAAAGTVNFNGNILDSACDVDVASQNRWWYWAIIIKRNSRRREPERLRRSLILF